MKLEKIQLLKNYLQENALPIQLSYCEQYVHLTSQDYPIEKSLLTRIKSLGFEVINILSTNEKNLTVTLV